MNIFESKKFSTVLNLLAVVGMAVAFFTSNIVSNREFANKQQTYTVESKKLNESVIELTSSIKTLSNKVTELQSQQEKAKQIQEQTQIELSNIKKSLRSLGMDF